MLESLNQYTRDARVFCTSGTQTVLRLCSETDETGKPAVPRLAPYGRHALREKRTESCPASEVQRTFHDVDACALYPSGGGSCSGADGLNAHGLPFRVFRLMPGRSVPGRLSFYRIATCRTVSYPNSRVPEYGHVTVHDDFASVKTIDINRNSSSEVILCGMAE